MVAGSSQVAHGLQGSGGRAGSGGVSQADHRLGEQVRCSMVEAVSLGMMMFCSLVHEYS